MRFLSIPPPQKTRSEEPGESVQYLRSALEMLEPLQVTCRSGARIFKEMHILLMVQNPARKPVEVCSLSHYLQGFIHPNSGCWGFLNHQQYEGHIHCGI